MKCKKHWWLHLSTITLLKRWFLYFQLNHPVVAWFVSRGCETPKHAGVPGAFWYLKAAEIVFHSMMAATLRQVFHALIDLITWTFCRCLSWYIMCRQTLCYHSQSTAALLICFSQNDPLHVRLRASRPTIGVSPLRFNLINNLSVFPQTDHHPWCTFAQGLLSVTLV